MFNDGDTGDSRSLAIDLGQCQLRDLGLALFSFLGNSWQSSIHMLH
jgi:hypothetical protein